MRNVIVTGGSRGLGFGVARKLASVGYRVIAVARQETPQLASAMLEVQREARGALHFKEFDLAQISEIAGLVRRLRKEFGSIYGLVNNAAIGTSGILASMHNAEIERLVNLNITSPLVLTKYVVRSMMADGGGRIVSIASIVSFTGYKGLSVYGATKASLIGFTRSLAREVGPLGINVNAIAPGFIDTSMTEGLEVNQRAQIVQRSALRRLAEIDDIANAIEFLLGDKAKNITGTMLTVDAGSTA
ncbi:MAG: SDR family NAD(P)-dependent oxidoreductase [Candidatus Binataceae bacterium]